MTIAPPSPVLLFVKAPLAGQVKSRLSAAAGDAAALDLYRCFGLDMLDMIRSAGLPVAVFVDPAGRIEAVREWLGADLRYHPQEGTDLGERMENAFRAIFAEGAAAAVLIGSDLPDLPAVILREAGAALETNDAVIGPAQDGGYYLIGFRREGFQPDIFRGIPWGGPDVFDRTMQAFRRNGASVHALRTWRDVDTIEDLRALLERNRGTAFAAGRTMRYLVTIQNMMHTTEEPHGTV